jgi:sialate O-acetylesterase
MKKSRIFNAVLIVTILTAAFAMAEVRMPGFFGDNMVLQRDRVVPVWGWADSGEAVTIEFAGQKVSAKAGVDGKWTVNLKAMKASSEPKALVISSVNHQPITIKNVVVGDVWICSGQSNMEWTQSSALNAKAEAEAADMPLIRHIKFGHTISADLKTDISGKWDVCSPASVGRFTAVGFYFARELQKELNVPIGLIGSNWGGTRVEPWVPAFAFKKIPELKEISAKLEANDPSSAIGKATYKKQIAEVEKWVSESKKAVDAGKRLTSVPAVGERISQHSPTAIFNSMINPLVPYGIRGAIWYQGESNGGEGDSYFFKKKALISGWRELWGYDFPFYFVQLANFGGANDNPAGADGYAKVREAQRRTLTIPKTGMAVIIDIGEAKNIHPKNKQDVGKRLALWALANEFGKNIVYSGPLYKDIKVDGDKIVVSFDHVGSGLMVGEKTGLAPTKEVDDGELKRFAIAGADKKWVWADAEIDGKTVIVSSSVVDNPVAVRYAFSHNPDGRNLYNKEGLPASPFRTDAW